MSRPVVAIDGPAGAGKTTVAKQVARDLDLRFLDTGAMYRCVALKASRMGLKPDQAEEATRIAASTEIRFGPGQPQRVYMDGEDVTEAIRQPDIGDFASAVSVHSGVRRKLVEQQQAIVALGGVVLEGRDTTTVVAPSADLKLFMTAGVGTRAERRFKELSAKGMKVNLEELKKQIEERDNRDSSRADSPLKVADGAVVIDTDGKTIQEIVSLVEGLLGEGGVWE